MPRYVFNVHDGQGHREGEAMTLPDLPAARLEALRFSGEVLRTSEPSLWEGEDWRLEVTDQMGLILFTLYVMAVEAPAVRAPA